MSLKSNTQNLKDLTTFGLDYIVKVFSIKNVLDIEQYFEEFKDNEYFVLGGGSNVLFSPDITNKNILKIEITGKDIVNEDDDKVLVKVGAGENWDNFVLWAIENNFSGIEALSAIPGSVGASPVQNIGAYGSEVKDVIESIVCYDTKEKKIVSITNTECKFSYRQSIFKNEAKNRYIIINVFFELKKAKPVIPSYANVREFLKDKNIDEPTLLDIRNAIVEIRWSKLPKPIEQGNCGSFFENPIISRSLYEQIKLKFPDIVGHDQEDGRVKIPAGYILEKAGLKGYNFGNVSLYEKNALVLVNNGNANFGDVMEAKEEIIQKVNKDFGIVLKTEPEIV